MSLLHKNGRVQWLNADGIGTQYTVSGLGFRPQAIRVWAFGGQTAVDALISTAHANLIVGFCNGALEQRSVSSFDQDAKAAPTACGTIARNDCVACTTNGAAAAGGILRVQSINDDGFVLVVDATTLSADLTIFYDVWGGSEITAVVIGDLVLPAATGLVDYTAAGMIDGGPDQVLMLAGCQSTAAMNTGTDTDAQIWIGFAKDFGQQCVLCGNSDDNSSPSSDTDSCYQGGECINTIPVGGAAVTEYRASFSKWNTDGFKLNWLQAGAGGPRTIFMAIKGGGWAVGELDINNATIGNSRTVNGIPFRPVGGILLSGIGQKIDLGTTSTISILCQGSFSGLASSQACGFRSVTAVTPTQVYFSYEFDEALVKVTAVPDVDWALDIDTILDTGFKLAITQTIGSGTPQWVGYMVFGSALERPLMGQVWH